MKRATAAAECAKTHANVQRERDMGVYACARLGSVCTGRVLSPPQLRVRIWERVAPIQESDDFKSLN